MATESTTAIATKQSDPSLLSRMAARFGVEPNKMLATLKATAFKGDVSNEQMIALLIVAEQHHLNPWVREIFAFPDKNNGIVPVVSVDGWTRILNDHPQYDGVEFLDGPLDKNGLPEWIECRIFRKDRGHPTAVREYMAECKRATGPWGSHPRRMLRHKSLIQTARIAMSFSGIYDDDEAQRIIEGDPSKFEESANVSSLNEKIKRGSTVIDGDAKVIEPDQPAPPASVAPFSPAAQANTQAGAGPISAPQPVAKLVTAQPEHSAQTAEGAGSHSDADIGIMVLDAIAEVNQATSIAEVNLACEDCQDDVKRDARFTRAVAARLDVINGKKK